MSRMFAVLLVFAAVSTASSREHAADEGDEPMRVATEACGPSLDPHCLVELRKVCHAHPTFRCYYSRKARLDAVRQVGFPDDPTRGRDE